MWTDVIEATIKERARTRKRLFHVHGIDFDRTRAYLHKVLQIIAKKRSVSEVNQPPLMDFYLESVVLDNDVPVGWLRFYSVETDFAFREYPLDQMFQGIEKSALVERDVHLFELDIDGWLELVRVSTT